MKKLVVFMIISVSTLQLFSLIGEGVSPSSTIDTAFPEVTVTHPYGGEELYIGDIADITWTATDYGLSANPITISYSDNYGLDYSVLDSLEANDGSYNWELPSVICYSNLIKIFAEDDFGNVGLDSSNSVFSITYVPPAPPLNVNVDLSNETDAVITWSEVDTTIFGTPINVDGYIVLYNETAYEDTMHCYYYLANTNNATTTYTHLGVVSFRDQMFYKVVAYKDYSGRIEEQLANISEITFLKPENLVSWLELQRIFK